MEYDNESHDLLQAAVDEGYIEEKSTAHGIALKCIDEGYEALSAKQKAVYDLQVLPHLKEIVGRREVEERMRGMPD